MPDLICRECGHREATHNYYSRCLGTLQQPDCRCLRTPRDLAAQAAEEVAQ